MTRRNENENETRRDFFVFSGKLCTWIVIRMVLEPQQPPSQKAMSHNDHNNKKKDPTALRVAQAELESGDTSGRVFLRLSDGAAAILIDRNKAKEHVASDLRRSLLDPSSTPEKTPGTKR